ncbi:MAG: urease accessory protein [Gammaproteobacteria bacterium]|nr:MAG: urease accessory protein [Gammaproteobacteria bacterium]
MNIELWSVLFLAFGLGMLHALDADHVMAVTGLSCQKPDRKTSVLFCARWALGHGAALMLIGMFVIMLGRAIPTELSHIAENLVGLVLVLIGVLVLRDVYRQHAHLHFHRHDDLPQHAHWHRHEHGLRHDQRDSHQQDRHQHKHTPVLVGLLHGTAGSAPLLALLPLSQWSSPWWGMSYLILFGMGVFLSMLVFGGVIGQLFNWIKRWGNRFITSLRIGVSMLSIAYGIKLLVTAM